MLKALVVLMQVQCSQFQDLTIFLSLCYVHIGLHNILGVASVGGVARLEGRPGIDKLSGVVSLKLSKKVIEVVGKRCWVAATDVDMVKSSAIHSHHFLQTLQGHMKFPLSKFLSALFLYFSLLILMVFGFIGLFSIPQTQRRRYVSCVDVDGLLGDPGFIVGKDSDNL